ncbi:hypothetical protein [Paludisphaera borealis]|uniref:Uncharacterized protein n=1 Tax=Paludisphaera borealis TaxID=1387353 RepID=A0A1U7CNP7_9BACT|nr:hypothetical protein [Paludisphaera borealis]APW60564.1 hypothetical protein BSF38_02039 [Paludisphaera borealis]
MTDAVRALGCPRADAGRHASVQHTTKTVRDFSAILSGVGSNHLKYARVLHQISPSSPFAMAGLLEYDWDRSKGDAASWREKSKDAPAVLGALGKR